MAHEKITISVADGNCPAHVLTSDEGTGGIRPAVIGMAEQLAEAGYVVLLPNLFYRHGRYGPFDPKELFKGDVRAALGPLMATRPPQGTVPPSSPTWAPCTGVTGDKVGAVGFCMGGGMAIAAAGIYPARFAAVASFHAGNLAIDPPDSPHTYASRLEAELNIAVAADDDSSPRSMAKTFELALRQAGVHYGSEPYPASHRWMKPNFSPSTITSRRSAAGRRWWPNIDRRRQRYV